MSLEDKIEANTAAIAAMTAALLGAKGAVAGKPAAAGKGAAAGKPKNTAEQVMAAAVKVKNEVSKEAAQFLITKHGADKLKELKPAVFDAFVADCEAAIEAGEVEGMDDDAL